MAKKQRTFRAHRRAVPIRPMNDKPIDFPRTVLAELSEDAITAWRGLGYNVDHDPFADRRRGYVSREVREAFAPTERILTAIAELEKWGFASYDRTYKTLHKRRVHPRYAWAQGRGSQLIKVSVFDEHPDHAELLAVLVGADVESADLRSGGIPGLMVRARHDDGTDFEHDASSTAVLSMRLPTQPVFHGYGRVTFQALLTEARLYTIGTDLSTVEDADTPNGTCDQCEKPHPFLPYQPPVIDLDGPRMAIVETLPLRPYLVRDPAAA